MSQIVQRGTMRRHRLSLGLAAFICCLAASARGEVLVEGTPAALRITTNQHAIADVLSALAANFNVKFRTAVRLDATAGANYAGSFGQVVSRLLDGYNYVIKTERETIEIVVFGRRGAAAVPPPVPKESPKGALSRWR